MHPVAIRDFGADRVVTPPGYRPVRFLFRIRLATQWCWLTNQPPVPNCQRRPAASFTKIKGYPLQNRKIYDNMFLYVLIYCYGDFHAEKISDCLSGIHGAFD